MPGTTCLARCSISDHGNTTCEAHRDPHPLWIRNRLTGRRRDLSLDDDPTSTSKGTSGFGAYALSGESVDVVVGVWIFAAGFTRKATPSACARRFRNPRRSQCTPGNVDFADVPSIGAAPEPARRTGKPCSPDSWAPGAASGYAGADAH